MSRNKAQRRILLCAVALVLAHAVAAQTSCGAKGRSIALPLTGNRDAIKWSYHTKISIGGGPQHTVQIDTGSIGIVVPRSIIPATLWNQATQIRQINYSSSNNYFIGKSVTAKVALGDPIVAETLPIEVLAAACRCKLLPGEPGERIASLPEQCSALNGTRIRLDSNKGGQLQSCTEATERLGMMGVGFGRGTAPLDRNPFLALPAMRNGEMTPGYTITPQGIRLGISPEDARGYTFIPLPRGKNAVTTPLRDWAEPQACVSFPNHLKAEPFCGGFLADTGLASMLLTFPPALRPAELNDGGKLPEKTAVKVTLGDFSYSFTTGGAPPAPTIAEWRGTATSPGHINTGRHILAVADYLFDDTCGRIGFRLRR